MVAKQTQDSMALTGILAGTVGLVAFVALMLIGGWRFAPALFVSAAIAAVIMFFLVFAFHSKPAKPAPNLQARDHGDGAASGGTSATAAVSSAASAATSAAADTASAAKSAASDAAAAAESAASEATSAAKTAASEATETAAAAAGSAAVAATSAAKTTASAAEDAVAAAAGDKDYDGDGVIEGENEGVRPEGLSAARDGKPDDLKQIKGIGPKLEQLCNSLGFYHFDQIAGWGPDEVAWVDANLEGFKGRVTRDTWVAQAKILAAGGTTEFSKKVDKGGVY